MSEVIVVDMSERFMKSLRAASVKGIMAGARYLQKQVRAKISTPYPPASRPGKAPHLRTGNLRRGIVLNRKRRGVYEGGEVIVGWSERAKYGAYHEAGITYSRVGFQRRPHIEPTFRRHAGRIAKIMLAETKRKHKV